MIVANKYPVVKIKWIDAESKDAWQYEEDIENDEDSLHCVTIGFLVRKPTKKYPVYFVANSITLPEDDKQIQASCIMKIPKAFVQELTILEVEY